jgi:Flp pilus assembly protein TadD
MAMAALTQSASSTARLLGRGLATTAMVLVLSACATVHKDADKGGKETAAKEADATPALKKEEAQVSNLINEDPIAAAAYWGSIYDSNPANADAAAHYGEALRKVGSLDRALSVLEQASEQNPQNAEVLSQYGKTLTTANRAAEASPSLERAALIKPKDASILSAEGVALDQIGDHDGAKERYKASLAIDSDNLTTLNNYALSCLLTGDLTQAESLLRQAVSEPGAQAQVRQNLSLVLALQGKYDEANSLANRDLLPTAAANNISYVRELLGQPAQWNDMSGGASAPAAAPDGKAQSKTTGEIKNSGQDKADAKAKPGAPTLLAPQGTAAP